MYVTIYALYVRMYLYMDSSNNDCLYIRYVFIFARRVPIYIYTTYASISAMYVCT